MPFPMRPANPSQSGPGGNPKVRTFRTSAMDSYTGPSYGERRGNTPVRPVHNTPRDVRRFGVMASNRGEWRR